MKKFKKFLLESVSVDNLDKTIDRFYEISDIDATGYYLKAGSPVFALGLYHLLNKKAELYSLSDSEIENLHIVVKFLDYYWDINGKSNSLKEKEEFISIVGDAKWDSIIEDDVLKLVESANQILDVYTKLKNIYNEKHFED